MLGRFAKSSCHFKKIEYQNRLPGNYSIFFTMCASFRSFRGKLSNLDQTNFTSFNNCLNKDTLTWG